MSLADNVAHAVSRTFGAESRAAWQSYATASENLHALQAASDEAHGRYRLASIASYGLRVAGSPAVPAGFFLPGQKTASAPTLPAKLLVAGGTVLAAAANYAVGLPADAQTTAQVAWAAYASATENLQALYGECESAFGQYRLGTIAAYGLRAAGRLVTVAGAIVPWGAPAANTGALTRVPQVAVMEEPTPSGAAMQLGIRPWGEWG